MNKRGFTLIELLGVIVILSIIMLIAVPNITSTLERSKRDGYLTDAIKMITLADSEIRKGDLYKPTEGNFVKITLNDLSTSDIDKDPEGVEYSLTESSVVIARKNGFLKYYVTLLADHGKNGETVWWGIKLGEQSELQGDDRYNLIDKNISTAPSDTEILNKINEN